jgi:hypothetical protein
VIVEIPRGRRVEDHLQGGPTLPRATNSLTRVAHAGTTGARDRPRRGRR